MTVKNFVKSELLPRVEGREESDLLGGSGLLFTSWSSSRDEAWLDGALILL